MFRVIELLTVTSVIGLACVSLKRSDPLFETIFFSFTLAFVSASILLAVGRDGGARRFWAGFAILSLSYLAFAHVPDVDETVPRQNGPEITTQLLRLGFDWMHAETYGSNLSSQPAGFFSVADDPFTVSADDNNASTTTDNDDTPQKAPESFPSNLSLIVGGGQRIVADARSMSFMRIGHAVWALVLGWIGGHFTQAVYTRSRRDRTNG